MVTCIVWKITPSPEITEAERIPVNISWNNLVEWSEGSLGLGSLAVGSP